MNYLSYFISYFNDGITDTGILFILVLVDTALAMSYQIKQKQHLLSSTLLAGLLRNFLLCFMPILVTELRQLHPRSDNLYQLIAAVLSIYIGYAIIQSILAYTQLWGINYPDWIKNVLIQEVVSKKKKVEKNDNSDSTTSTGKVDKKSSSGEQDGNR